MYVLLSFWLLVIAWISFKERNVEVIGVSIDSHFTHNAWRNTDINDGGIGAVKYPLVADMSHSICKDYGVETPDGMVAFRGSFLIDTNGVVRHQVVNDLPLGRDIDEMLRMVDATALPRRARRSLSCWLA